MDSRSLLRITKAGLGKSLRAQTEHFVTGDELAGVITAIEWLLSDAKFEAQYAAGQRTRSMGKIKRWLCWIFGHKWISADFAWEVCARCGARQQKPNLGDLL